MITKVTIGIQARSTSRRFPGKVHEKVGNKTILEHVVSACQNAALYLNNWNSRNIIVETALLIPEGDKIKDLRHLWPETDIFEGSESDVLSRYRLLLDQKDPDYIVRVTADCPLIPSFVISKLITLAVMNEYDYVSNVHEKCRTSPDGMDCEVFSEAMLRWVDKEAIEHYDREHVTTYMRSHSPPWAKIGTVINFLNLSHLKLSVDNGSDLAAVKEHYQKVDSAYQTALGIFGKKHVHRF